MMQYTVLFISIVSDSMDDLNIETKNDFYIWLIPIYGLINFLKTEIDNQLK